MLDLVNEHILFTLYKSKIESEELEISKVQTIFFVVVVFNLLDRYSINRYFDA